MRPVFSEAYKSGVGSAQRTEAAQAVQAEEPEASLGIRCCCFVYFDLLSQGLMYPMLTSNLLYTGGRPGTHPPASVFSVLRLQVALLMLGGCGFWWEHLRKGQDFCE